MKLNLVIYAGLYALIAAIGNAVFVYGQKKSTIANNPFFFLVLSLLVCIILLIVSSLFYSSNNLKNYLTSNFLPIMISGIGLYFTFFGFYLLFTRYGASYYILYAVLSILTTSIFVGIVIFSEKFNMYYFLSIISALSTIVLFSLGQMNNQ